MTKEEISNGMVVRHKMLREYARVMEKDAIMPIVGDVVVFKDEFAHTQITHVLPLEEFCEKYRRYDGDDF